MKNLAATLVTAKEQLQQVRHLMAVAEDAYFEKGSISHERFNIVFGSLSEQRAVIAHAIKCLQAWSQVIDGPCSEKPISMSKYLQNMELARAAREIVKSN